MRPITFRSSSILSAGEHGTLIGHVARNNDLWRDGRHDGESLAVFQSADAYISPNWYATKQETHEVVPTWNYAVVHVYGPIVVHDDEKWVRGAVGRLTKKMEALQPDPWKMADAPAELPRGNAREYRRDRDADLAYFRQMEGQPESATCRSVWRRRGAPLGG